jgi:hypothetical protein
MVPIREAPVLFGSAVNVMVADPEPVAIEEILIHEAVDAADHKQPLFAVTPTEYEPPPEDASKDAAVNVIAPV